MIISTHINQINTMNHIYRQIILLSSQDSQLIIDKKRPELFLTFIPSLLSINQSKNRHKVYDDDDDRETVTCHHL